jgi:hypothetical protein
LSGGDNQLILHAYCWGSSNINLFSYIMTAAAWIGKRVRFQLDYTPGTMSGSSVANDGSLIFSLIDLATSVETVVYNVTGRDLYLSQGGDSFGPPTGHVPADNHISGYALGLYGLTGDCERFLIQAFEEVVTSPSPEPPEPEPTTLPDPVIVASEDSDCATSTSDTTKENTPGPIEPVVDPVWYPMCIGQGTVATAPDLIDPESWVS